MIGDSTSHEPFVWWIPRNGFQWTSGNKLIANAVEIVPDGVATADELCCVRYQPLLTDTALFALFSETKETKADILQFASTYGFLTPQGGLSLSEVLPKGPRRLREFLADGESFDDWSTEIKTMRTAVSIWKQIRQSSVEILQKLVYWQEDAHGEVTIYFVAEPASIARKRGGPVSLANLKPIVSSKSEPAILKALDREKPAEVLTYYLMGLINDHLQGFSETTAFGGRLRYEVAWDFKQLKRTFRVRPESLLVAMWLQFARAVEGGFEFRSCAVCHKLFEISPPVTRRTRLHCSDACKLAAYRQRQVDARKMYSTGMTFKEIAQELRSEVATVRKWLTGE